VAVYRSVKRALDVAVAGAILVVGSPVIGLIALMIRIGLGRPVLFRQERAGVGGRTFALIKFRTMRTARPGQEGPEWDAVRLTRLGRVLRATSLDELPTFWSVLRGDLSLVGPRPLPVRYLERYSPEEARRHEVKPGVTGWAQVNGRNALSWQEKFRCDVWYVDHRSLSLDLRILGRTARQVVSRGGISQEGHATMPEFTNQS
jgi:lipopolysaccharide/colanic/teichoic acid biosynthesis glycosyltransferase